MQRIKIKVKALISNKAISFCFPSHNFYRRTNMTKNFKTVISTNQIDIVDGYDSKQSTIKKIIDYINNYLKNYRNKVRQKNKEIYDKQIESELNDLKKKLNDILSGNDYYISIIVEVDAHTDKIIIKINPRITVISSLLD